MDYVQMTLDDWMEMKKKLREELLGVTQSFVRIGYALRKIDDQKLYERDGYKSIAEFAKEEYGLDPSTTSRFIKINKEYSIDGYSEQLRPEFAKLGRSQLEEMLRLPDEDRGMIQPETSREDIRDLKRFNKSEPAAGVADDINKLIEKFYQEHLEILNAVFSEQEFTEETIKQFAELVNPGGNRSYKKGLYFLMMYENRVVVKKFGAAPQDLTWWDFWKITREIFGEVAAGPKTWQNYFGGPEDAEPELAPEEEETQEMAAPEENQPEPHEEKDEPEPPKPEEATTERSDQAEGQDTQEEPEEEIAPAQKKQEMSGKEEVHETTREDENSAGRGKLPEQAEPEAAEKQEEEESESGAETMNSPEILDKPFGSRKEWIDTLTPYGLALELAKRVKAMLNENLADMTTVDFWEDWLKEEVDDKGRTIEE